MSPEDLFKRETGIIDRGERLLAEDEHEGNPLLEEYRALLQHYRKLLKQAQRLVKMSDRMQSDMNELNERLGDLSSLDGLTGIANRRRFDEVLAAEWKRACRNRTLLSVIMMDIDFFKAFNDRYGHAEGDRCLQRVAEALSSGPKRPVELVARYGGEEFVAILPSTDVQGAATVAERMRRLVGELDIPHQDSSIAEHVTVSLGVATQIPCEGDTTPDRLLQTADRMLYQAKEAGRNRVCAQMLDGRDRDSC